MSDLTISADQAAVNAAALRVAEAQAQQSTPVVNPNGTTSTTNTVATLDVAAAESELIAAEARLQADQAAQSLTLATQNVASTNQAETTNSPQTTVTLTTQTLSFSTQATLASIGHPVEFVA